MTLTAYEQPTPPDNMVTRWVSILAPASQLADRIAGTEFVPAAMRDKPDVVCAAILYGDEIGLGPMQALASIHVVDGRPAPSSELMRALIFRAGHAIGVETLSGSRCLMWARRAGSQDVTRLEWTLEMARAAGLLDKRGSAWRAYPRAMLLARCSSELARIVFPDVIKGLGHLADDPGTVDGFAEWAATVPPADEEPAKSTVRRRTPRKPEELPPPAATEPPQARPQNRGGGEDPDPAPAAPEGRTEPPDLVPEKYVPAGVPLPEPGPPLPDPWDGADPWREATPDPPAMPETVQGRPVVETPLPDPDDAAPVDPDSRASDRLIRSVFASFHTIGAADDDDLRHAIASEILRREVTTFTTISKREALRMVGVISDLENGALVLTIDPNGKPTISGRE